MAEIARQRLANQRISTTAFETPHDVVHWLGAMQGQDYPGAKWSVGLRLPDASDAQVEAAIDDGSIVRTWAMRGTLHLVAAEDVHWLLKLIEPSMVPYLDSRIAEFGLDVATAARAFDLMERALEDGQRLERLELLALLQAESIPAKAQAGRYLLHRASAMGLIGQSVNVSNRQTFILLEHLPPNMFTRAEALAELARRYFTSRGPATVHDFASWAALSVTDARAGLDAVKDTLVSEMVGKVTYWLPPSAALPDDAPAVHALPGFDEFLLGYKERGASLEKAHYAAWCPGKNGVFNPTIVSNGRVVGMWKRTLKKGAVQIEAAPLRPLTDDEQAGFEAAARRYAAFIGMEPVFVS